MLESPRTPPARDLLILTAMREEANALREVLAASPAHETRVGGALGVRVQSHRVFGRTLHLAECGVGPVNAALAVASAAHELSLSGVVLLGVGGAVSPSLRIGDAVVSSRVLQHDSYSSLDFGDVRMAPGDYVLTAEQARTHVAHFGADAELVALVSREGETHVGTVLSGSEFVGTTARKLAIASLAEDAMLVEMEAAGVAQVASRLKLPFVVVKTVADRLHPDGTIEQDFTTCLDAAAKNAARVLRRCLEA